MARKIRATRRKKPTVLIALEDTKSAKYYINELARDYGVSKRIEFVPPKGTNPKNVLKAINLHFAKASEIESRWLVFDKDDYSKEEINGTISSAKANRINIAFSNESYELWILLHFEDVKRHITRKEINKRLNRYFKEKYNIEYTKASIEIYGLIKSNQEVAINRAKELYNGNLNSDGYINYLSNPLTTFYKLVEHIKGLK